MSINGGHESCPSCGGETAYFNGMSYECPECDYKWGVTDEENDDDEISCPHCGSDDVYMAGPCYMCSTCNHMWGDDNSETEERDFVEND